MSPARARVPGSRASAPATHPPQVAFGGLSHILIVLHSNVGGMVSIGVMKPIHALLIDGWGNVVSEAWSLTRETDAEGNPTGILIWTSPTGHRYRSEPEEVAVIRGPVVGTRVHTG